MSDETKIISYLYVGDTKLTVFQCKCGGIFALEFIITDRIVQSCPYCALWPKLTYAEDISHLLNLEVTRSK